MEASGAWRWIIDLSILNLLCSQDTFQNGDSPVGPSFCEAGSLDGLPGSQGRLFAGPCPSGQPQISEVCGLRHSLPAQGIVFWSFHGPSGLHEGHGSSFNVSSPVRHQDPQIPRRLASSGPVEGAGPQSVRDYSSTRSSQIWFLPRESCIWVRSSIL